MPRRSEPATILAAVLLAVGPATSGAAAEAGSLNGYIEARAILYRYGGTPDATAWGLAYLSWEKRLSDRLVARARGSLHLDARGEVDRGTLYDDDERDLRRALLRVEEATLTWTERRFDLAGGRMVIPWGRADGFNPTDNLTPFDTLDPLEPERLPSWAMRGRVYAGRATFEAVWLPRPGVTRLPLLGARWLPLPESAPNASYPAAGPRMWNLDWREGEALYPSHGLENSAWAVRAEYRASSWEGSISHYRGWDDQPILLPQPDSPPTGASRLPVALDRVQPDLEATGADLAWVLGPFVLRVEAARHDRGGPVPDTFHFAVIEGEWTRGDWRLIGGLADISGASGPATAVSSFEQAALPAAILHVERSVPTGVGASIRVISNLDGEGRLVQAEVSWPLAHAFRATIGADAITGPSGTFLGAYRRNDRLLSLLRWSF